MEPKTRNVLLGVVEEGRNYCNENGYCVVWNIVINSRDVCAVQTYCKNLVLACAVFCTYNYIQVITIPFYSIPLTHLHRNVV